MFCQGWPAQRPDLNPIEHLVYELEQFQKCNEKPSKKVEFNSKKENIKLVVYVCDGQMFTCIWLYSIFENVRHVYRETMHIVISTQSL